jgi:hypothetical protein
MLLAVIAHTACFAADKSPALGLPVEQAKYREWSQILKVPYQVPIELYMCCIAPRPKDWDDAQRKYGPHTQKFIRVGRRGLHGQANHARVLRRRRLGVPILSPGGKGDGQRLRSVSAERVADSI